MNKVIKLNKETLTLQKKIQAVYALTLMILSSIILVACITYYYAKNPVIISNLHIFTTIITIIGILASVPFYVLEKRVECGDSKQISICNFMLNLYLIIFSFFAFYMFYTAVALIFS